MTNAQRLAQLDRAINRAHEATGFYPRYLVIGKPDYHAIVEWRDARAPRPGLPNSYRGVTIVLITDDEYDAIDVVHGAEHEIRRYRAAQRQIDEDATALIGTPAAKCVAKPGTLPPPEWDGDGPMRVAAGATFVPTTPPVTPPTWDPIAERYVEKENAAPAEVHA